MTDTMLLSTAEWMEGVPRPEAVERLVRLRTIGVSAAGALDEEPGGSRRR